MTYVREERIVRFADRSGWRQWLSCNFGTAEEAWFVFPTKDSGEDGVTYNDAVEEALCLGWIDSISKRLDDTHQIRRFTPRRKGAAYTRPNIERLIWLDARGMIHPDIRPSVLPLIEAEYVFPEDILAELREDPDVWRNYCSFTEPYRRIRIAYIDAARNRPDEYQKRLDNFISMTRANRIIGGYGGVGKYYR